MTVLYGITGSLLGVVVGAFLTRWIDAGYERRREVREAVASALTLREELRDTEKSIKVMVGDKRTTSAFLFPGLTGVWESHCEILLAVGFPHGDWVYLAHLFRELLEVTTTLREKAGEELAKGDLEFLETLCEECADGRKRLEPFIVEVTKIPLTRPTQIFSRASRPS